MNKAVSGSHFFSCVYLHFSCQHKQWLEHKLAFRSFYQCIGNTEDRCVLLWQWKGLFVLEFCMMLPIKVNASQTQMCIGNWNVYLFMNRKTMNNCLGLKHWLSHAHSWINNRESMWREIEIRNGENACKVLIGTVLLLGCILELRPKWTVSCFCQWELLHAHSNWT